jgi:hypothetical protein
MTIANRLITFSTDLSVSKSIFILLLIAGCAVAGTQQSTPGKNEGHPTSVRSGAATLLIMGAVRVNDQPVSEATSTVFTGDRIQTLAGAAARVWLLGLSVYLPVNSCLGYGGQQLELCNSGSIDVDAMKSVSVTYRAREIVISSVDLPVAFTMTVAERDLWLVNRVGSSEIARSGAVLSKVTPTGSHSFAGLGCAVAATSASSCAGIAAAVAVPPVLSTAIIKAELKRQPLSSTTP